MCIWVYAHGLHAGNLPLHVGQGEPIAMTPLDLCMCFSYPRYLARAFVDVNLDVLRSQQVSAPPASEVLHPLL